MVAHELGDMILIPANVCLFRYDGTDGTYISKVMTTDKPQEAILLEKMDSQSHKIYLDGEFWLVLNEDIYGE